jgi:hypothetical protein
MTYGFYDRAYYERTKKDKKQHARRVKNSRAWYARIKDDPDKREAYRKYQRDYYRKNWKKPTKEG